MSKVLAQENVENMIGLLERAAHEILEVGTMTTVAIYSDFKQQADDSEQSIAWHLDNVLTRKIDDVRDKIETVLNDIRNDFRSEEAAA